IVQERWDRHGRKRQRDRGWCGGGRGDTRKNSEGARIEGGGEEYVMGGGGSRCEHHGNWTGAVFAEGAAVGGADAGATGSRGSERGVRCAISGRGKGVEAQAR